MPLIPMGTRCQRGLASWPGLPAARHLPALCCAAAWRRPGRVHAHRQCADDVCADHGGAGIVSIETVSVLMGGYTND